MIKRIKIVEIAQNYSVRHKRRAQYGPRAQEGLKDRRHDSDMLGARPFNLDRDIKFKALNRLMKALADKEHELHLWQSDLCNPLYADIKWVMNNIDVLSRQINEINRYLVEGGYLYLPLCCVDNRLTCLISMEGFDNCIMTPFQCGFGLRLQR